MSLTDHTPRWVDAAAVLWHQLFVCEHDWEKYSRRMGGVSRNVRRCHFCARVRVV